jgi:L-asparagine oxygenase
MAVHQYQRRRETILFRNTVGGAATAYSRHSIVEVQLPSEITSAISEDATRSAAGLPTIDEAANELGFDGEKILRRHLPPAARVALEDLARADNTVAVILRGVANMADFTLPATPVTGFMDGDKDRLLVAEDMLLAGAMRLAGTTPFAFPFENRGRIGRNVVPNPEQADKPSSHGSKVDFFFHSDNPGQPFEGEVVSGCTLPPIPRQLGFFTIRNAERVPTRILPVDAALRRLSKLVLSELAASHFRIAAPASVVADGHGAECVVQRVSILRIEDGVTYMRFDPLLVTTKEIAAIFALARLVLRLKECALTRSQAAVDVVLRPGDVLLLDNRRCLHMRVAFSPLPAARSRWLRRFYGKSSG